MRIQTSALILTSLLVPLWSCSPAVPPGQPLASPNPQASAGPLVFAQARSRRSLNLSQLGSLTGSSNTGATVSPGISQGESTAPGSPAQPMPPGGSAADSSMPFPGYYGGGEFNQYTPVMAEESLFAGNSSRDLVTIYEQSVVPLLQQWDLQARLLESRGNTQSALQDPNRSEYVYVPGLNADQPLRLQPDWVFRFASTPRKETLTVYITAQETRAYRVVWGEPDIAIREVKVSVSQAVTLARQALRDRNSAADVSVYPMPGEQLGANQTIVYDLPENINWSVNLGQKGPKIVYYLSANYVEAADQPGVVVNPAHSSGQTSVDGGVSVPPSEPGFAPDCRAIAAPYLYLYAFVSLDAITGQILSKNRPVRYHYTEQFCQSPEEDLPKPQ